MNPFWVIPFTIWLDSCHKLALASSQMVLPLMSRAIEYQNRQPDKQRS